MGKFIIKFIVVIVAIIIIILFLVSFLLDLYNKNDKSKAMIVAQKYIDENYEQEMVFEKFSFFRVEEMYWVEFSKKENPDFKFTLNLSKDRETSEFRVWSDDYLDTLICYGLKEKYQPIVNNIWGDNTHVSIRTNYTNVPKKFSYLNEYSSIDEIKENGLNDSFTIYVDIPYFFGVTEKKVEAEKIIKFVKIIQEDEYLSHQISVERLLSTNESSKDSTKKYEICWIDNIDKIESIEQVYDYIDKYWFK